MSPCSCLMSPAVLWLLLCSALAAGCENATAADAPAGPFHLNPTLSTCVTEMLRAICGALRPVSSIKRNTELINSILGLPRVLQDAGR